MGALVSMILAYKLGAIPQKFNRFETSGMAITAASMVLTVGPILGRAYHFTSPFDDWSVTLTRLGLLLYFIGRLLRHWLANRAANHEAKAHLKSRGKL
jgi:hypothetical protein